MDGDVFGLDRRHHLADIGDPELARFEQGPYQGHPSQVGLVVVGLIDRGHDPGMQQRFAEVVLQGGNGDSGLAAQISDSHLDSLDG